MALAWGDAAGAGSSALAAGMLQPPNSRSEGPPSSTQGGAERESGWRVTSPSRSDPRKNPTRNGALRCRAPQRGQELIIWDASRARQRGPGLRCLSPMPPRAASSYENKLRLARIFVAWG